MLYIGAFKPLARSLPLPAAANDLSTRWFDQFMHCMQERQDGCSVSHEGVRESGGIAGPMVFVYLLVLCFECPFLRLTLRVEPARTFRLNPCLLRIETLKINPRASGNPLNQRALGGSVDLGCG